MAQKDELRLLRNALDMIGVAAAALTGCFVWAYLMGRCFEWAYLVPFNATWMLDQFSTVALAAIGWPSIVVCGFIAIIASHDAQNDPIEHFVPKHFLWVATILSLIYVTTTPFLIYELLHSSAPQKQQQILWLLFGTAGGLTALVGFTFFHSLKNRHFGWNLPSALILLLGFLISIGHLPAILGLHHSFQDYFTATSSLPQVAMKTPPAQVADFRLLLHANGSFYTVDLLSPHHDIRILSASDVAFVSGASPVASAPK